MQGLGLPDVARPPRLTETETETEIEAEEAAVGGDLHPPGRRRLRSAGRADGYETWTIEEEQYDVLRAFILDHVAALDRGDGVLVQSLIEAASVELAGHPRFPSGRFTNWIRFVKVDLECEGVIERVGRASPQRVRLVDAIH